MPPRNSRKWPLTPNAGWGFWSLTASRTTCWWKRSSSPTRSVWSRRRRRTRRRGPRSTTSEVRKSDLAIFIYHCAVLWSFTVLIAYNNLNTIKFYFRRYLYFTLLVYFTSLLVPNERAPKLLVIPTYECNTRRVFYLLVLLSCLNNDNRPPVKSVTNSCKLCFHTFKM